MCLVAACHTFFVPVSVAPASSNSDCPSLSPAFLNSSTIRSGTFPPHKALISSTICVQILIFQVGRCSASLRESEPQYSNNPLVPPEEHSKQEVEECVKVLKNAAKTRRVAASQVLSALAVIEKAKLDPSRFLNTLGGSKSPGRTWMLIFTTKKQLKGGSYFPLTAVQRFDAPGKRIENGVYLGPLGSITFEGRFSWNKRILAFIFELLRIKIGPLKPFEIGLRSEEGIEPSNAKDPFFVWFYVDDEIAVARGKSGGTAFWCRCRRITYL